MIILVDCDGILSDFVGQLASVLMDMAGFWFTHEDVTEHNFSSVPGWKKEFWDYCREPGFVAEMPLLPGAVEGVRRLREKGDVVCVTAPFDRSPHWMHERQEWLQRHFHFRHQDVIFTHRKELVQGDVLIDDRPEHVRDFGGRGLLWTRPWNKNVVLCRTDRRVASWDEVLDGLP